MKKAIKMALAGAVISGVFYAAPTAEAASYTVQKGDTLSKIAKAHNTTIQQLKQWNQLTGDRIYIAQTLTVAQTESAGKAESENTANKEVENELHNSISHKVIKGDTLTKVAKKYNTTVDQILVWNDLKTDAIQVGQQLTIKITNEVISEAPTASEVEEENNFKETADAAIEKQLNSEKTAPLTISAVSTEQYTKALEIAKQAIGIPYKYGGNTMEGFDCSGFVSYVYNNAGIKLGRKSSLQYFQQDTQKVQNPLPWISYFSKIRLFQTYHIWAFISGIINLFMLAQKVLRLGMSRKSTGLNVS